MKIGLIGTGRLGLCFALLMERAGYEVLASDSREDYIKDLRQGVVGTAEPDVHDLLWDSGNIDFTTDNRRVIRECDIIFTLVATPSLDDGSYDVSAVWNVVNDIKDEMTSIANYTKSFVVGCTTNPGDCDNFKKELPPSVDVFYNPEFIAQGTIVKDLINADMVLIGGEGKHRDELAKIYHGIQDKKPSIHFMSTKAAEITKIAVNCFLTTKISYANMLGQVLSKSGLEDEIEQVLESIGSDSRVGNKYLKFGFGFGGPCFPRDNRAFAKYAEKVGLEHNFGYTTDNFNNEHAKFIKQYFIDANLDKLPYLFESVAYKEGTDILTESQQYRLCIDLLDEGYEVYVKDDRIRGRCDGRIKFEEPNEEVFMVML
tara:strand:- start:402 stop:1517 length:1116 start_codon:yes stop_codon:yes gene_type:complete